MMRDWKAGIHVRPKKDIKKAGGAKTAPYMREQMVQFTMLFASGFDRSQIISLMELGPSEYEKLFSSVVGLYEKEITATSPQKAYVHYVIKQTALMREIQQMKGKLSDADGGKLSDPKTAQAFLAAIKVQSDMADRIIRTGVELGVLERSRKGALSINGLDPRDAEDRELGEMLEKQISEARRIANKGKSKGTGAKIFVLKPEKTGTEG